MTIFLKKGIIVQTIVFNSKSSDLSSVIFKKYRGPLIFVGGVSIIISCCHNILLFLYTYYIVNKTKHSEKAKILYDST